MDDEQKVPRKRGRPLSQIIKLDATPEEVAKAIFAGAKPPDPSLRKPRKEKASNEDR